MGIEGIPEIVLSTLGFDASLLALLLAAQGYVAGRLPPSGGHLLHPRVLWTLPGLLLSVLGVYWSKPLLEHFGSMPRFKVRL